MPDFFPLFDVEHKLVFDQTGAPVFARVRNGSIGVSLGVSVSYAGDSTYPAGSGSWTFNATLTRSSYKVFSSNLENDVNSNSISIGNSTDGYACRIIIVCGYVVFNYTSKTVGWSLDTQVRTYVQYWRWSTWNYISMGHALWRYRKTSGVLIPDGTTARYSLLDHYYDTGVTITVPTSLTLTFTET